MLRFRTGLMRPFLHVSASMLAFGTLSLTAPAQAQIGVEVTADVAPPPLITYDQPPLPAPGYLWTPGYWYYGPVGYYWVPGTWVEPPAVGLLWTPGWWGFGGGHYLFHAGFWGPTVGFYGGINYGFGYTGVGYFGGYWRGGAFFYNGAVNHFGGVRVTNVYVRNVTNVTVNHVSYNGPGGVVRQPTPTELAAAHAARVVPPTAMQTQHVQLASQNHALLASVNHGRPAITATSRPAAFPTGAQARPYSPPAMTQRLPVSEPGMRPTPEGSGYAAPVGARPAAPPGTTHPGVAPRPYVPPHRPAHPEPQGRERPPG